MISRDISVECISRGPGANLKTEASPTWLRFRRKFEFDSGFALGKECLLAVRPEVWFMLGSRFFRVTEVNEGEEKVEEPEPVSIMALHMALVIFGWLVVSDRQCGHHFPHKYRDPSVL